MPSIEARLKDVLDDTRLVMLGIQLLMGVQYTAAFTPGFARLPTVWRWLDAIALLLILYSAALLLSTPAFHQLADRGHATGRMLTRASRCLGAAMVPSAIALGIDVALAFRASAGNRGAALAGTAFIMGAACAWFATPLLAARSRPRRPSMEDKQQSLEVRIVQVMTELRVILPGAQALFGFQAAAVFTDEFNQLTDTSRYVHLASVAVVAVSVIMLLAPAAYHHLAAHGEAEQGVLDYGVRMMLPAEGLIALGIVGDAYVTVRMIAISEFVAIGVAAVAFVGFTTLLYVLPLMGRRVPPRDAL